MTTPSPLPWIKVDSSNLDAVAYDEMTKTLCVMFQNSGLYTYNAVDMDVYTSLVTAESVGRYLNTHIKPFHPYAKWDSEAGLVSDLEVRRRVKHG